MEKSYNLRLKTESFSGEYSRFRIGDNNGAKKWNLFHIADV